jgi:hypothetical protein
MTHPVPCGSRRTIPGRTGPSPTGFGRAGTLMLDIRVAGQLDDHWAGVLGGLVLSRLDDSTTRLTGPVADQAQLHGILARIRDLGVPLLSLHTLHHDDTSDDRASETPAETPAAVQPPEARPRRSGRS